MPIKSSFPSSEVSKIPLNKKVLNLIDEHIKLEPNKIALICAEDATKKITYKELRTQVASVATFLSKRGFGHLDVSCQVLPNSIEYGICYLAALECGGVMSGASAMFTDYELERQFVDSRCSVVFTDDAHIEKVLVATARIPKIKTVICLRETTKPLPAGVIDWDVVVNTAPAPLPAYPFNAEDMCLLPYSSGTTGSPKGVMLSHRNFGTMMQIVIDHYDRSVIPHMLDKGEVWDYRKETFLLALPFYHIYGCGLLHLSLMQGMTGIIMKKFDPVVFLSTIQAYKPKVLNVVPPVIVFLTKTDITNKFDLSSLRFVLSGAAPCGKDLGEEFLNKFKNIRFLLQAYGMTESGMASHLPAILKRDNFITCGAIAANFEEKIIDVATGKEVKQGERGEICVRGPTVMKGYLNRPEATAETIDKDGWLHTGDIGYQGPTGETFIVDRLKELIKVKGLQVPPAELEDLLLSHPNIKDAAVIGIPDPKTGEKPKAFVVRGSDALTAKEVQSFVAEKVSSYKHLAAVEFIPEIPKVGAILVCPMSNDNLAPSGKILRRFLRDREAKQTAKL